MKNFFKEKELESQLPEGVPVFPLPKPQEEQKQQSVPVSVPTVDNDGFTVEVSRAQKKERKIQEK